MGIIEDSFRVKAMRLKLSIEQVGLLSDVRPQAVFAGLKGSKPLRNQELEAIDRTLRDLQALAEIAKPFTLDFSDTRKTRFLLGRFRDGDIARAFTPYMHELAGEVDGVCS